MLSDLQQYADPDGEAERAGISSAQWPLFGQLWPSGLRLAEAVQGLEVAGRLARALHARGFFVPRLPAAGQADGFSVLRGQRLPVAA